jgi:hypothetical protein
MCHDSMPADIASRSAREIEYWFYHTGDHEDRGCGCAEVHEKVLRPLFLQRGPHMRVSFDLDDTAWKYRRFFAVLAWALKRDGHEIGILTGHEDGHRNADGEREGTDVREADLRLWEARGFPPADFLLNASDCRREGIPWHGVPQRVWKLELARRHGVTCHVDDFAYHYGGALELCLIDQADESKD